jgi:hypothetical protein
MSATIAHLQSDQGEFMPTLRFHPFWLSCGYGFVLLVIVLSLMPPPPAVVPDSANFGHIIAYFWLMIWFAQVYRRPVPRILLAVAFGALGVTLEFVQGMTGYRHFDYLDMVRNFVGIAFGLVLARTPLQDVLLRVEHTLARYGRRGTSHR